MDPASAHPHGKENDPTESTPIVDERIWTMLSERVARGDRAKLAGLVEGFLAQCAQIGRELREAFYAGRLEDVSRLAHKLGGSGGAVGALALMTACRRLEEAIRQRSLPAGDLSELVLRIETAISDSVAEMNRRLGS